jgi:UDP-N-acetylmuramoyl-tripeptide--D-alanyl-D-alanine ligase
MADIFDEDAAIKVGAPGRHIVQNILGVLAVAKLAGADMTKSVLALADMPLEKGRGTRHQLLSGDGRLVLIDESYNANPASMRAAIAMLEAAKPEKRGRRIAVLGDMLELGEQSGQLHALLAGVLKKAGIDHVYLVGAEMHHLAQTLPSSMLASYVADVEEIKPILFTAFHAGDVVMVKASKGIGFAGLVEDLVKKFTHK